MRRRGGGHVGGRTRWGRFQYNSEHLKPSATSQIKKIHQFASLLQPSQLRVSLLSHVIATSVPNPTKSIRTSPKRQFGVQVFQQTELNYPPCPLCFMRLSYMRETTATGLASFASSQYPKYMMCTSPSHTVRIDFGTRQTCRDCSRCRYNVLHSIQKTEDLDDLKPGPP